MKSSAENLEKIFNLKNKVAVVIGGGGYLCSSMAEGLAMAGCSLVIVDIRLEKAKNIADKIKEKFYTNTLYLEGDVTNEKSLSYVLKKTLKDFEKVDILINGAGINSPKPFLEINLDDWNKVMDSQITGTMLGCKTFAPHMIKNKSGSIINISSTAGLFGFPQRTPYTASKWAIIGLTKSLAMELGKYKIRVNAICPGSVKGERMQRVINAKAKLLKTTSLKIKKEFESMTSMSSFVSKENIASMIIFLLSDHATNISGQSIAIDGNTERMI